jgi:hypothetical protein
VALTGALVACGNDVRAPADGTSTGNSDPVVVPTTETEWEAHPPVEGLGLAAKGPRRLSVEQLEHSLDQVAGLPVGSIRLPDSLARILGRPDYQSITSRSFDPSPLFMKHMIDIGAFICDAIVQGDQARPPDARILSAAESDSDNARRVWFRFTGIEGPEADEAVERLTAAMNAAGATPRLRAMALCMAAATSPEFLLY